MNELSPNQIKAATLLVTGMKSKDIATEIGVTPETISIWKRYKEFIFFTNKLRQEYVDSMVDKLRNNTINAMDTLNNLASNAESEETRRKAAKDILDMTGIQKYDGYIYYGIGLKSEAELAEKIKSDKAKKSLLDSLKY